MLYRRRLRRKANGEILTRTVTIENGEFLVKVTDWSTTNAGSADLDLSEEAQPRYYYAHPFSTKAAALAYAKEQEKTSLVGGFEYVLDEKPLAVTSAP